MLGLLHEVVSILLEPVVLESGETQGFLGSLTLSMIGLRA